MCWKQLAHYRYEHTGDLWRSLLCAWLQAVDIVKDEMRRLCICLFLDFSFFVAGRNTERERGRERERGGNERESHCMQQLNKSAKKLIHVMLPLPLCQHH